MVTKDLVVFNYHLFIFFVCCAVNAHLFVILCCINAHLFVILCCMDSHNALETRSLKFKDCLPLLRCLFVLDIQGLFVI